MTSSGPGERMNVRTQGANWAPLPPPGDPAGLSHLAGDEETCACILYSGFYIFLDIGTCIPRGTDCVSEALFHCLHVTATTAIIYC